MTFRPRPLASQLSSPGPSRPTLPRKRGRVGQGTVFTIGMAETCQDMPGHDQSGTPLAISRYSPTLALPSAGSILAALAIFAVSASVASFFALSPLPG